jgi:hypothetical protein
MMEENKKKKIGKILYVLPLALLGAFVLALGIANALPSKRVIGSVFFVAITISTCSSLLTDDIGLRGAVVNRFKQPKFFWFQFGLMTIAAMACLWAALRG